MRPSFPERVRSSREVSGAITVLRVISWTVRTGRTTGQGDMRRRTRPRTPRQHRVPVLGLSNRIPDTRPKGDPATLGPTLDAPSLPGRPRHRPKANPSPSRVLYRPPDGCSGHSYLEAIGPPVNQLPTFSRFENDRVGSRSAIGFPGYRSEYAAIRETHLTDTSVRVRATPCTPHLGPQGTCRKPQSRAERVTSPRRIAGGTSRDGSSPTPGGRNAVGEHYPAAIGPGGGDHARSTSAANSSLSGS